MTIVHCSVRTVFATVFEESARVPANYQSYVMYHLSIMKRLSEKFQGNRAIYIYTNFDCVGQLLNKHLHKNVVLTS